MKTEQPTQEEQREFWEWYGWHLSEGENIYGKKIMVWVKPNGKEGSGCTYAPSIDLNNLFKWAVPKMLGEDNPSNNHKAYNVLLGWLLRVIYNRQDPALALFWALWQVKEASNE